ncbi:hypothetical protein G7085_19235 [Tessaracoccus sp. HDW20]|uniref:hypothetical protein n=1 Tax=Tessaracoccus coleopterorum TaxID=2714950 RepID=UPI0018D29173|nr:hypothetical protein [Tessaracoccus coleopterorum]NHB85957.1 hypothetical protein [Tessaracoccus coleopterorum]
MAGLVRPTAAPLIATLGLVWLVDVAVTWRREGRLRPFTPQFWALAVASSGFAAYLAYVAWRMGSLTGYLEVQAAWNQRLGTPLDTLRWYAALEPGQPGFALYASVGVVVLCYLVGGG